MRGIFRFLTIFNLCILQSTTSKTLPPEISDPLDCGTNNCTLPPLLHPLGSELCPDDAAVEQEIIDTLMTNYTKQSLPTKFGINASIEIHVNDIPALNELSSEFTLDIMYSEMWNDVRLSYADLPHGDCVRNITLGLDYLGRLWTPNTCIVNSKSAIIHASPSDNVFLILYSSGAVWKNCRMMVRAPCKIDLRQFPFDEQACEMIFESYSYNSQKVGLRWFDRAPITMVQKVELPDFTLIKWTVEHNTMTYPNGNWDQLKATFYFKRRYGFFILQAYVPTYMTIFVAWITFWIDAKELSTRSTLGISAFLAITLQFGNILKNQPPVSYVKALDVWMLGCISFLFAALAELAVVSYMMRSDKPNARCYTNSARDKQCRFYLNCNSNHVALNAGRNRCCRLKVRRLTPYQVDKFCMVTYIPIFLAFNLFYWFYIVGVRNF